MAFKIIFTDTISIDRWRDEAGERIIDSSFFSTIQELKADFNKFVDEYDEEKHEHLQIILEGDSDSKTTLNDRSYWWLLSMTIMGDKLISIENMGAYSDDILSSNLMWLQHVKVKGPSLHDILIGIDEGSPTRIVFRPYDLTAEEEAEYKSKHREE